MSDIQAIQAQLLRDIETASDVGTIEAVRVAALGKAGSITALLKTLGVVHEHAQRPKELIIRHDVVARLRALITDDGDERQAQAVLAQLVNKILSTMRLNRVV